MRSAKHEVLSLKIQSAKHDERIVFVKKGNIARESSLIGSVLNRASKRVQQCFYEAAFDHLNTSSMQHFSLRVTVVV